MSDHNQLISIKHFWFVYKLNNTSYTVLYTVWIKCKSKIAYLTVHNNEGQGEVHQN